MSSALVRSTDLTVKYLSTAVGRDRINRFLQYFSRFLIWYGQRNGFTKENIARITALMAAAGQTRKMMRAGRQIEFFRNAQKSLTIKDEIIRATTVGKNVSMGLWLTFDLLQLIHSIGLYKFESIKDIQARGNRFWFIALLASLIGGAYKINAVNIRLTQEKKLQKSVAAQGAVKSEELANVKKSVAQLESEKGALVYAAVQDSLDILIPASSLEYIKLESGIVGLAGSVTSLMGGYTQLKAVSK
ncbi:peroxisomal biogenesis factor 11 [Entophlyctis helioformis]|nr:peroxisomal biogenesis factor 11 [Entophlyctis helioformis]